MNPLRKIPRKSIDPVHHGIGLVVDSETTGGSPQKHGVVEFAIIPFVFHRGPEIRPIGILEEYATLLDPGPVQMDPIAMRIHGISPAEFRGHKMDPRKVRRLIQGAELVVAHNASFDARFLAPLLPELGSLPWACSLYHLPWASWGHAHRSLTHLCAAMGIEEGGHRALGDARATLQLLARNSPAGVSYFQLLIQRLQGLTRSA